MQKISLKVFEKMTSAGLSGLEIDFLLEIGKKQDISGCVRGVYYRDLTEELHCSIQQFYNLLHSLSAKKIISYTKATYYDYDVVILDNDFSGEDSYRQGYISLNKGLFRKKFRELKANEKLLAMELFRRQDTQYRKIKKPSLCFKLETMMQSFTKFLGVTARVLKRYLKALKDYFSIGIKDGYYYITPLKATYSRDEEAPTDDQIYSRNEVKAVCRRNRIEEGSAEALKETASYIQQYACLAHDAGLDVVEVVTSCILRSVDKTYQTFRARERKLEPLLIHKLIRMEILPNLPAHDDTDVTTS